MDIRTNIDWEWETDSSGNFRLVKAVSFSKLNGEEWEDYSDFDHYPHRSRVGSFTPRELARFLLGGMQALNDTYEEK